MIDFGTVKPGRTLYIPFDSFAGSTGASITLTGLAVTDIEIYKDGGTTQRSSDNGYTLLDTDGIDFDGITGIHGFSISLADNSDAGFYAAGSRYFVVVSTVTVDSQTVSFVACTFSIGHPDAVVNTTIATLSTQTSFTLTAGPAEDDALNDMWLIVHDVASAVQMAVGIISDYTGSTKTVTLAAAPTFTMAATDNISVMGPMPMQPTVAARKLDVTSTGGAGIDWGNVENPTTTVGLSGTTVKTATDVENDTADIQSRLPAALTGDGNIKADTLRVGGTLQTAKDLGAINVTNLNTLSGHDPGETIMGATDAITVTTNNDKTGYSLADDAITASKFDESTAFPLKSADSGSTLVARTGADSDTLETLSDQLDSKASQSSVDTIDGIVDAILLDTGTDGVVLSSTTLNAIADALLDRTAGVETNRTPRQALRIILASAAGKLSGAATTTVAIRDTNDSKDRITATVDADGNRTAVTLDAT